MNKENQVLSISDYDFILPDHLIAQVPLLNRDSAKLLIVDRQNNTFLDKSFKDILSYLKKGDILIRNNSKVIPARLIGYKEDTLAKIEILLLKQTNDIWECLVKGAKKIKIGSIIIFGKTDLRAEILEKKDHGLCLIKMHYKGVFLEILEKLGEMPLPPYIKEKLKDKDRYQTVYAKISGSSAAPTAGLHFSSEILSDIEKIGVEIIDLTLHVGLGTFRPIEEENILNHHMHEEFFCLDSLAANKLNAAKKEGRRIIAIGTTTTRVLETIYKKYGEFKEEIGYTDIFLYPGVKIDSIDGLLTNFHLPKSTLLLLISAFANKELIFECYKHAIDSNYRFFSFGDAMLII